MPSSRPLDRLYEIIDNCERILTHVGEMSFSAYAADIKTKDAVERCLSRISEAAYKLGNYLDDLYPDTDWKGARGVGNKLRHGYDEIIDADIWDAVVNDIPNLRQSASDEITRLETKISVDEHNDFICSKCHSAPCICGDGGASGGPKL